MSDLSSQLTVARAVVQTFNEGLSLFTDDDLHQLPGSSSAASQRVSGTSTPSAPYNGDQGLPGHVLRALRQAHLCAIALCAIPAVDDPLPWAEAPQPERTVLPALADIHAHLDHLDHGLQQVQHAIHGMDFAARVQALVACEQVLWDAGDLPHLRRINHPRWDRYARRARMQCSSCWRLAGRAELCQHCMGDVTACKDCGRDVQDRGTRCYACRKRLSRAHAS